MIKISASTHPAKDDLIGYFKELEELNIDMLHCDVMDGEFVEDKTINYLDVAKINAISTIVLDVHLMVANPKKQVASYREAGANILTVHYEAFKDEKDLIKMLKLIKKYNMLAGLSIKPQTTIEQIYHLLPLVDLVLVMSVEPGKSGQKFMTGSLSKISKLRQIIKKQNLYCLIEVDGGINDTLAKDLISSGADILVVGSFIFNAVNKLDAINALKK